MRIPHSSVCSAVMTAVLRVPTHRYQDPLALVWIDCAARVGYRVARTTEAYASTDGRRNLLIGEDATLDADDSLAQMILHELCHHLDYELYKLPETFHTEGFYKRESSLYYQIRGEEPQTRR